MKKIIIELVITLGVIAGVLFSGGMLKNSVLAVDVYRVEATRVEDTVICSGKIEYKETCNVTPATTGIVADVMVEKGDTVEKGDILFTMVTNITTNDVTDLDSTSLANVVNDNTIKVEAPVSGSVLSVDIESEDAVTNANTAVTIVNSDSLCVNVPISENKISQIEVGQPVKITGSAFNDKSYNGTVVSIDNIAKQVVTTTGKETAVDVIVNIENPDNNIKQGYTAKCTITTNVKDSGYIIPYEAVEMNNDNSGTVYTFNNGKAKKQTVKIGNEYENGVEVLSGLKSDDLVIYTPETVSNQTTIKIDKMLELNDD